MRAVSQSQLKRCPQCGASHFLDAPVCHCGHQFRTQFGQPNINQTQMFTVPNAPQQYWAPSVHPGLIAKAPGTHSVFVAILLHLLLTGAGQMYNQQVGKGFTMLGVTVLMACAFFPIAFLLWVVILADAIAIASKLNLGYPVREWQFF